MTLSIRLAQANDLDTLLSIEQQCFTVDRLSRRSFKYHLNSAHSRLLVAESIVAQSKVAESTIGQDREILGYVLCLLLKGTRLARLYSLAVLPKARGQQIGLQLLNAGEQAIANSGRLFMRLEVAKSNKAAIRLYELHGYRRFGEYLDYYEDHQDALRMQKKIWHKPHTIQHHTAPWCPQTTDFTCGPCALMMAMATLDDTISCEQSLELELWRESTTIFMTSGLGGTHPFGLALAAQKRGFSAEVFINNNQPLFIDGVRTHLKKQVMTLVHQQFEQQCQASELAIHYQEVSLLDVEQWLSQGKAALMLISTYRLDGAKAPHWVFITGIDERCLYVHDSDVEENWQVAMDCQHTPIARTDFEKMSMFGTSRLRCAIVIAQH
ncbi:GNAT family N-acetyltransferase/peptidase C39 family protein [Thalassotalea ganghwensis]